MAITRNSTMEEVVEFLESKGLGELKQKMEGNRLRLYHSVQYDFYPLHFHG